MLLLLLLFGAGYCSTHPPMLSWYDRTALPAATSCRREVRRRQATHSLPMLRPCKVLSLGCGSTAAVDHGHIHRRGR